jgi:dihydrofolate reductase
VIISIIVAMSENKVIGINNKLPWHLSEDLKRFKTITEGHTIVMGRKTYESIGSKPLPKRLNIVLSNQELPSQPNLVVCKTIETALKYVEGVKDTWGEEVFICGGAQIYSQTIKSADKLYLTIVHDKIEGDAFFPEFQSNDYTLIERIDFSDPVSFSFLTYRKKK